MRTKTTLSVSRARRSRRAAPMRGTVYIATLGVVLGLACSSRIEDKPKLIEHRIASCEKWCGVALDSECGAPTNPELRTSNMEECVEGCATLDGSASGRWGYQDATGADGCIAEYKATIDCVAELSCEDKQLYFSNEILGDERPCFSVDRANLDCVQAHPCCGEEG